jgi:biopolymer transport protein ExbB
LAAGVILGTLAQIFLGIFQEGGWVLWPIFGVSVIGWYTGLEKLVYLRKIKRARSIFALTLAGRKRIEGPGKSTGLPAYDELLKELRASPGPEGRRYEFLFREFLSGTIPDLDHGFSTMAACVSIAPLLGLLGTISGMNRMFSVITDVGLGSPGLMAGGISVALESALAGLAVAVAIMFFHNYLYNKKKKWVQTLLLDGDKLIREAWTNRNEKGLFPYVG